MTHLSVEIIKKALEENNGIIVDAAISIGVKHQTIRWWISQYNIPFNNKNKISATPEEVWEEYQKVKSLKKVAEKLGGSSEGIRDILKRNGYQVNKRVIHTCNHDFFKADTEESFYWAGFIAADGCVKNRIHSGGKNPRYELQIGLSQKDKLHIEKFKKAIKYDGPIRDFLIKNSKRNPKWNDVWKSEIAITSKDMFNDLARFNVVPRKSLTYTFPEWLIDHPMVNHFMRGYFDGDGSVYETLGKGKKTPQKYISIRGTVMFLTIYRNILERECNLKIREKPIRINNNIGNLEYGGNGLTYTIRDFLYKNAINFLDRKENIWKIT